MLNILFSAISLLILALLWYLAYTRHKVGLKHYAHAMVAAATVAAIFKPLGGVLGFIGALLSVLYWALYFKSLLTMREHGLDNGFGL